MELTREQIEQMPAGREMDGLIAEHILGFRRSLYGEQVVFESPEYQQRERDGLPTVTLGGVYSIRDAKGGRESVIAGNHPKSGWPNTLIDFYSTDIAAAWKVVEALEPRGYLVDITRRKDFTTGGFPYECEIWDTSAGPDRTAQADVAPLAICRAALLTTVESSTLHPSTHALPPQ